MAPEPAAEMSGRIVTSLLTAMDGINTHSASAGTPSEPPTALDVSVSLKCSKPQPAVRTDICVHAKVYVCADASIQGMLDMLYTLCYF